MPWLDHPRLDALYTVRARSATAADTSSAALPAALFGGGADERPRRLKVYWRIHASTSMLVLCQNVSAMRENTSGFVSIPSGVMPTPSIRTVLLALLETAQHQQVPHPGKSLLPSRSCEKLALYLSSHIPASHATASAGGSPAHLASSSALKCTHSYVTSTTPVPCSAASHHLDQRGVNPATIG